MIWFDIKLPDFGGDVIKVLVSIDGSLLNARVGEHLTPIWELDKYRAEIARIMREEHGFRIYRKTGKWEARDEYVPALC